MSRILAAVSLAAAESEVFPPFCVLNFFSYNNICLNDCVMFIDCFAADIHTDLISDWYLNHSISSLELAIDQFKYQLDDIIQPDLQF